MTIKAQTDQSALTQGGQQMPESDVTRHCFREDNCAKHRDHEGPDCCCCGRPADEHTGCDCEAA